MKIDLAHRLNNTQGVHAWKYTISKETKYQLYLARQTVESVREVQLERVDVTIYRKLENNKIGSSSFYFSPMEEFLLDEKLEKALYITQFAASQYFDLPKPTTYPKVELVDERVILEPYEVLNELKDRIVKVIASEKGVSLSSSEIYLIKKETTFANSNGIRLTEDSTGITYDFVIMAGNELEVETHAVYSARNLKNLGIEERIAVKAKHVRDMLKTKLPQTGKTAVILSDDILLPLFEPLIQNSSGPYFYKGVSNLKAGNSMCAGCKEPQGDRLTLLSNPLVPYGVGSMTFDRDGISARKVEVISDGIMKNIWATKQFADYLGIEATGEFGNTEVKAGSASYEDIFRPADKPIYYVTMFSWLNPDLVSGDIASEIRSGYEIMPDGTINNIRGGSVSANIFEMFANARFSKETTLVLDYLGPKYMRFEDITVAGS